MNLNSKNYGFTLVELLVVIAIIGILAAVVMTSLNSARSKSRDARRLADVRQVMTSMEVYFNDNGAYPTEDGNGHPDASLGGPAFSTYLATYPSYPLPSGTGCTMTDYNYSYISDLEYTIEFCLEGESGGFSPGNHTATQAGLQ
ncbi:MAG: prepilin-type N-terminal cleavage/methylation domain-containing protein [Candidatus Doudnabacteria bacterium]|nr:prepilin-type N-terminal cleavage/methylation domain-containing protein [Candidatus Doudnabacteria bacterium]